MKTALILCPCWSREMPHLAIALLSARLKSDGHDVFCLDLGNELFSGVAETDKKFGRKRQTIFGVNKTRSPLLLNNMIN